jgi:hypothetical protein
MIDHFRYFAAAARAEEGRSTEIEKNLVVYHFREPLGVVGQIVPFNLPLLMAAWKLAPALAAGNCSVIKPTSPTPWSILKLAEVIEDVVPPGVINIVTGPGAEIGKALAANPRIAKISFTGETVTGRLIMQYAAQNLIPSTVELGGKSPNIFFSDVMAHDDEFLDKAVEGLVLYAFNKGELCTCPSRALIQADIYDEFMARCLDRIGKIRQGNPLDTATMLGPQISAQQIEKIASYIEIGRNEGAEVLIGGNRANVGGEFADGYYFKPTVLKGNNKMRVFQEEIFGPVLAVTTFFGVGGLGHLALQYARIAGGFVIAVDIEDHKLAMATDLGADHVVNARTSDPVKAIQALGGADVAVALAAGDASLNLPIFDTVLNGKTVIGSIVGTRNDLADVFALHAAGRTKVIAVDRKIDDVNQSIDDVLSGRVPVRIVFQF